MHDNRLLLLLVQVAGVGLVLHGQPHVIDARVTGHRRHDYALVHRALIPGCQSPPVANILHANISLGFPGYSRSTTIFEHTIPKNYVEDFFEWCSARNSNTIVPKNGNGTRYILLKNQHRASRSVRGSHRSAEQRPPPPEGDLRRLVVSATPRSRIFTRLDVNCLRDSAAEGSII